MPDWTPHLRTRLAQLRLSPTRENEIIDELALHLEDRWRELVAGGATEEEAMRLALAQLRKDTLARNMALLRQAHSPSPITPGRPKGRLLSDLSQDLRYAARIFWTRPGFVLAVVLTLALGLGANAAIFAVINAILLRPLPLPHSDQLLAVYTRFLPSSGLDFPYFGVSGPELADIRSHVSALAGVGAYNVFDRNLTRDGGDAERVKTMSVTSAFFDVLGVRPVRGRTFTEEEAQRGGRCLALLRDDASDSASSVIGSTIRLDDAPCEVIGVMPKGFVFRDERVRVWTALRVNTEDTTNNRGSHVMTAVARLRDGVGAEQADAQIQALRTYWGETYPEHHANGHFAVTRPLQEDIVGDQRDAWLLLGGAVTFVLLIVCVNIAALLVSRGESRRREFAVRHALGASRERLVRQLAAEVLLLTAIGGLVAVVFAHWFLAGLLALYPQRLPVSHITIDYTAAVYVVALIVVAGLVVGLVPAVHATGMRMQDVLRADSRIATSTRRAVVARSALVVSQLAVSVVLLVGALLLIRSYQRLQQVDLGVQPDRVLAFTVIIPRARQEDVVARRTLETIADRLSALPGVESVGGMSSLPLAAAGPLFAFRIEGRPDPAPGETPWNARYLTVMPQVFQTLRVPLKRGRLLAESDRDGQPLVAVINEAAARFWSGDDPVGRTIRFNPQETNRSIQIVGVVGDIRSLGPSAPAPPAVYLPLGQSGPPPATLGRIMRFVVRTAGDPTDVVASARTAVASVDPGLPLSELGPMADVASAASGQPRFTTLVMSFFAGTALLLAALGLYGTLSYSVERRVREIGVRMALGASKSEVFRLMVGSSLRLAFVGVLVGIPAALASTRLLGGLFDVERGDPPTYVAVVAMLGIAAFLASYLPARRATRVDPLVALRTD
jgi:putative ABC transport system permease protein